MAQADNTFCVLPELYSQPGKILIIFPIDVITLRSETCLFHHIFIGYRTTNNHNYSSGHPKNERFPQQKWKTELSFLSEDNNVIKNSGANKFNFSFSKINKELDLSIKLPRKLTSKELSKI